MEARSRIVVESIAGRLRVAELRSEPPLTLRRTGPAEISIVGSAAAPLGGDRLALDVVVGAGASLVVRSVAASLAYPGVSGDESTLDVSVTVGPGAALDWAPQPTVAVTGCRHHARSSIALADESSRLRWCDVMVRGRSGERSGAMRQRLDVDRAGRPLLRNEVAIGGNAGIDDASFGDHRVIAGAVRVGEQAGAAAAGTDGLVAWACHPLAPDAGAWTVLGRNLAGVRAALDRAEAATRKG
ncbi:urease accessory protein UreD [Desertimonas flava]|uniref:urease accessory protein UreD n=1 Tax=Desertimonas flava TaxID=2064846 RepID=UPI0013C4DC06|nr:urease accessory protein UreD [Desertimonas flava]